MTNDKENCDNQLDEAEILAQKILASQPNNPDALNGLGLILMHRQRFGHAVKYFRRAVDVDGDNLDSRRNLVRALIAIAKVSSEAGEYDDAIATLRSAIIISPDQLDPVCHLSFVFSQSGRHNEALSTANKALGLDSEHPHPHDVKGLALIELGRTKEALGSFRRAIEIDPNFTSAYNNLGIGLMNLKEHEAAIKQFECVLQIDSQDAQAYNNLGLAFADTAKFVEAEAALVKAIEIAPDYAEAHFNHSRILLMCGNYEEGWRENEWRWRCSSFPSTWRNFPYPQWRGESVTGKTVLVWSEQGIGDEIMFANPIPDLLADGAKLVLECGERLVPLFARSFQAATVVARCDPPDKRIRQAQIDYQTPMASLCSYYRNTRESFHGGSGSYLTAGPIRKSELRARYAALGDEPVIGICWRSGNPIAGPERSAPLNLWDSILSQPNCNFVSLQYGEVEEDLANVKDRLGVEVHRDTDVKPLENAEDWFAQVAAMDLVISIDNSTIQVSGAQGIPTWTLLSYLPEWRFGMQGKEHDWHPSIRVYRQPSTGDWQSVFSEVIPDFADWLHSYT